MAYCEKPDIPLCRRPATKGSRYCKQHRFSYPEQVPVAADPDDICPKNNGQRHVPDWNTVTTEWDGGELYLDVRCEQCGRSGCIGTDKLLAESITW